MLKPVTGTNTGVNKLLVGQVIGHRGEHTTIILLNVHTVKSTLSDLSLYPQINASLKLYHFFCSKWQVTQRLPSGHCSENKRLQNIKIIRVYKHPYLMGHLYRICFPQVSDIIVKYQGGKV